MSHMWAESCHSLSTDNFTLLIINCKGCSKFSDALAIIYITTIPCNLKRKYANKCFLFCVWALRPVSHVVFWDCFSNQGMAGNKFYSLHVTRGSFITSWWGVSCFLQGLCKANTVESVAVSKWQAEGTKAPQDNIPQDEQPFFFLSCHRIVCRIVCSFSLKLCRQDCKHSSKYYVWTSSQGKPSEQGMPCYWYLTTVGTSCKSGAQRHIHCHKLRAAIKVQISASKNFPHRPSFTLQRRKQGLTYRVIGFHSIKDIPGSVSAFPHCVTEKQKQ